MRSRLAPGPLVSPLAGLASLVLLSACGGGPPALAADRADVVKAEQAWCAMLAQASGAGAKWEHEAACKAAFPTGSAGYIGLAAKCFKERLESMGKDAPDSRELAASCNDDILFHLPAETAAGKALMQARCDRMERCDKIPQTECKAGTNALEPSQRALFTTSFNDAALGEILECFVSKSCQEDEEAARTSCYEEAQAKRLWFPL